ncbi:MAG: hypothetical protein PHG66_04300, partial [Candidatus Colwellbacteria bacterium]|nr:hypothetical protein [Candidatus Colwellbacteria bacterium]
LVELLIVIAILAVLAAAVVVVLNPAELLAQARDSQRVSDLDTMKNALAIYISQASSPSLGTCTAGGRCTFDPTATHGPFATATCAAVSTTNTVAGAGWINVDLSSIAGGSPIPYLPVDPSNTATYFYAYMCANSPTLTYELDARLESQKQRSKMASDGGNKNTCATYIEDTCFYEIGTDPALDL